MATGSFKGCQVIFHTASPFWTKVTDPQKELVDPAVAGTNNVLAAARDAQTVTRVVLTSSVAAVTPQDPNPTDLSKVFTEDDWQLDAQLTNGPYRMSKRMAEQAAWDQVKAPGTKFDLVVINPSFILGPGVLDRSDGVSVKFMRDALEGRLVAGTAQGAFGVADVRDVASAHIAGMLQPEAGG